MTNNWPGETRHFTRRV